MVACYNPHKISVVLQPPDSFSYSTTISARVSNTTLIIICKELIALESSTSPFNLPVNAGLTEETGPNATMASVWRTSKENGARK